MIRAVAFCPQPPLLVPEVAQGAAAELDELRDACRAAVNRIMTPGRRLAVVGAGPRTEVYPPSARGSLAGYLAGYGAAFDAPLGSDEPGPVELPLSLTLGAWLLRDALGPETGAVGVSVNDPAVAIAVESDADADLALLVMGDGSARRSTSAPGYFDPRAEAFDAQLADALRSGRPAALRELDTALGDQLLSTAPPVWVAVGRLLGDVSFRAELLYDAAPYGVGYFVAAWTAVDG